MIATAKCRGSYIDGNFDVYHSVNIYIVCSGLSVEAQNTAGIKVFFFKIINSQHVKSAWLKGEQVQNILEVAE